MKLLLSMAADGALVVLPQPAIMLVPSPSNAVTASTAVLDQGSCAPTSRHPIPSRSR